MIRRRVRINLSDLNGGFDSDPCSFQHSPSVIEFDTSSPMPRLAQFWCLTRQCQTIGKDLHRYSKVDFIWGFDLGIYLHTLKYKVWSEIKLYLCHQTSLTSSVQFEKTFKVLKKGLGLELEYKIIGSVVLFKCIFFQNTTNIVEFKYFTHLVILHWVCIL